MLTLTVALRPAQMDARRGVVRLHTQVMSALGLGPWATVTLQGSRLTGALAALAPPGAPPGLLLCDALVLANLGVADGGTVQVAAAPHLEAAAVTLTGPPDVVARVDPDRLRLAVFGKVLSVGDTVSLLPQDLAPHGDIDVVGTRKDFEARLGPSWTTLDLSVAELSPAGPALVSMATSVGWFGGSTTTGSASFFATPAPAPPPSGPGGTAAPVPATLPGLEEQLSTLSGWLDLGFHHSSLLTSLGSAPGVGVLVTGPAGSGKATLVVAAADALRAQLVRAWGPELAALPTDVASQRIAALVADAGRCAPSVLLLEDIDALAPREGEAPLLANLVTAVRGLVAGGRVAVACTSSRPEAVAPSLREPGVLDQELSIPLPDRPLRLRLLAAATAHVPLDPDLSLDEVAAKTPGFVAADLHALLREAGLRAAARQRDAATPTVSRADIDAALEVVRPTSMEGARLDLGQITLDDVGDMADVKQALTEAVLWPLTRPEAFARLGIQAVRGVLLYGPPGCGKTYLVKAIACSGEANVLSVKGGELLNKYVGESERGVRELFQRAREASPAIVFLDEVDALAPVRGGSEDGGVTDRVVAALLTELDGIESLHQVVVIAATNRPDLIDPALLRPGRIERKVFVPPPDAAARALILAASAVRSPLDHAVDLAAVSRRTDGFSSADCAALIREAALTAMRRSLDAATITGEDVEAALGRIKPSLDAGQVAALAAYAQQH